MNLLNLTTVFQERGELVDFYDDICRHLKEAQNKYSTFESDCREASRFAGRAASACKREGDRLNRNKKIGGVVGGGVAAAGIGTGVALSVVAGIFTFGVGTVIGLATTAAASTVAGVVTGVGTAIYAVDCHLAERKLDEVSRNFDSLTRKAECLQDEVPKVHDATKKLQDLANEHFNRPINITVIKKYIVDVHVKMDEAKKEVTKCVLDFKSVV